MSSVDPIELPRAAQALFRAIEQIRRELARTSGLTLTELRALTLISDSGTMHPTDVARALGLGLSATTAIGDKLSSKNLITRSPDPHDRRKVILEPTTDGTDLARAADQHFIARITAAAEGSSASEIAHLTATMRRIADAL